LTKLIARRGRNFQSLAKPICKGNLEVLIFRTVRNVRLFKVAAKMLERFQRLGDWIVEKRYPRALGIFSTTIRKVA